MIVFVFSFEDGNIGEGVVGDPEPVGEGVGDHDIDGVVASGQEQEYNSAHAGQQGEPVEGVISAWGIWKYL